MGIAIWALIVYIGLIIVWATVLKRNLGEAMIVGFVVTALFGGRDILPLLRDGLIFGATHQVLFVAMAFVAMAYVVEKTGMISKLIAIMNSLLGRLPGGSAYVDTVASALFGMISGSGTGNTATVGAITIPWMKETKWKAEQAATIAAGNAGMGISFPPSSSMFILLGMSSIGALVSTGQLYVALLVAGSYTLIYRLLITFYFVKRYKIKALPSQVILPARTALKQGWSSLFIFAGVLIPILLTIGPIAEGLQSVAAIGAEGIGSISIIVWVPILIILISFLSARDEIPRSYKGWFAFFEGAIPSLSIIGVMLMFAFAASNVLGDLGLAEQLGSLVQAITLPNAIVLLLLGLIIVLVATPLTATSTVTALGLVMFDLMWLRLRPVVAVVVILVFASTEGATPPSSAPIFIASGLANVNPTLTFKPLILFYVIPIVLIGWLIALGILPIPTG